MLAGTQLKGIGFCWSTSTVLLHACRCFRQLVHSDYSSLQCCYHLHTTEHNHISAINGQMKKHLL